MALLAGFLVVLWRGMRLYWYAHDDFGRYLALSVTIFVFVQALINISVVLDLAPNKGIPLPLISYGGSSLLSTLLLLGMLLSVSEHACSGDDDLPVSFLLAGGGTGGHVFPPSPWRDVLRAARSQALFVGTRAGHGIAPGSGSRLRDRVYPHSAA